MAVVNTLSDFITALDAKPNTLEYAPARMVPYRSVLAVAAADDDTSVYRAVRAHTSQRLYGVMVTNSAITNGTDYDFGAYRTAADGGAVIDADNIVDGRTMASAVATPTFLPLTTGNDFGKKLWEILGYTSDPGYWVDLSWTANTVGTAAGTITTIVLLSAI